MSTSMLNNLQWFNSPYKISSAVVLILSAWKWYLKLTAPKYYGKERLDKKTVIVTGASAGIGAEAAEDFAKRGARVVMLCRDVLKGEKVRARIIKNTRNTNLVVKYIDFACLESVRKCAYEILEEESRIDILLNNAGIGISPRREITVDGLNKIMQTNHFGPFLLTNILLRRIKESAPSRIVNVTSDLYKKAILDLDRMDQSNTNFEFHIYCNSKLANIYSTITLANRLKDTDVTVNSVHPGFVKTEINRDLHLWLWCLNSILVLCFAKTVSEGAQTLIYTCLSPSLDKVTGKYFADCQDTPLETKEAEDLNKADSLWDISEVAVELMDSEKHY